MVAAALAARVVEVITDLGKMANPRYRYGSGCIVSGRAVLTAAHVVVGAAQLVVRDPHKREYTAMVDPQFVGDVDGPRPDLALLEIDDPAFIEELAPIGLAVVDRDSATGEPVERCHAIGYPWFAETQSRGAVRDTVDAIGVVPVLSKLAAGLLSVQVRVAPRELPPQETPLTESQWSGMSGAPVIADGFLLGVVTEHAPREGPSAITAVPLTALEADPAHQEWGPGVPDPQAWWSRLGAEGIADFRRLPLPSPPRPEPAYRATLREFGRTLHQRMPQLLGRERELADIAAFATGVEGYRWLVGGAFTGKTALLYEAVTVGLPENVDMVCYFLSRRASDASSDRFLAAVVPQLAYLCDMDPPVANVDHYHELWQQAVTRAEQNQRHLLLVVDGLDEDLHPSGSPSVASLLPGLVGAQAHVLVASRPRPELPDDVPVGHLQDVRPTGLDPFKGAQKLAELAKKEIRDLTKGDDTDLAVDILGLLTAAAGPLSVRDLATLRLEGQITPTASDTRRVRHLLEDRAARSLERVGPAGSERYQFAHYSLLQYAQTDQDLRAPAYRQLIHDWAQQWRDAGWPVPTADLAGTPRYLFDSYPASLTTEPDRLTALVGDVGWVATTISVVGVDQVLADLRSAATEASSLTAPPALLGVVSTQTTNLRPPQPVDQPAYVLRQLCLQAMELGEEDVASAARTRLATLPDPGLVPLWTTRRASSSLGVDVGTHEGGVAAMVLSYGRVVTGGDDGRVLAWDLRSPGADPVELGSHRGRVSAMVTLRSERTFDRDEWRVVTGGDDGRVLAWDLRSPGADPVELGSHRGRVSAMVTLRSERTFDRDEWRVVTGGDDGRVLAWDLRSPGADPVELGSHRGRVSAMVTLRSERTFDRDEWRVVTGGDDGRVLAWDLRSPGADPVELGTHRGPVSAMTALWQRQVVTGGDDGRVLMWTLYWTPNASMGPTELGAHRSRVSVAAYLDEWRVITGGDDGRVLAWDLRSADRGSVELGAHRGRVSAVSRLGDGRVVTGWDDGIMQVWDPYAGAYLIELGAHRGRVSAAEALGDGQQVVTSGDDGRVLVWKLSTPRGSPGEPDVHRGPVSAVAALADGRIVIGGNNGQVLVWDPGAGTGAVEFGAHRGPVAAVTVLADGRVVTSGKGPRVLVWDPANADVGPVKLGTRQGGRVAAMAALGDGRVVTAGYDGRVLVWDPGRPGAEPIDLGPQQGNVSSRRRRQQASLGALARVGDRRVVTGGNDGRVLVWELDVPGVGPVELGAHNGSVRAVAVLGDGRIVTGGDDGLVLLWDPDSRGADPVQLGSHSESVKAVTVLRDGRVVTGGSDRWLAVWDPHTGDRVAEIRCPVDGLAAGLPSPRDHTELIIRHGVGISGWSIPELAT